MDNKHDGSKLIGRRQALQLFGVGLGAAGGLVFFGGCKKGGESGGGQACAEMGSPDDKARTLRTQLKYMDKSEFPDKTCKVCLQYEEGKFGADCGGCKLFGGGVKPEGHCLSFAPKSAVAPAGGTPGAQPPAPAPAGGAAPAGQPAKPPG